MYPCDLVNREGLCRGGTRHVKFHALLNGTVPRSTIAYSLLNVGLTGGSFFVYKLVTVLNSWIRGSDEPRRSQSQQRGRTRGSSLRWRCEHIDHGTHDRAHVWVVLPSPSLSIPPSFLPRTHRSAASLTTMTMRNNHDGKIKKQNAKLGDVKYWDITVLASSYTIHISNHKLNTSYTLKMVSETQIFWFSRKRKKSKSNSKGNALFRLYRNLQPVWIFWLSWRKCNKQ